MSVESRDFEALAASVAHEMGTPLSVVGATLRLLDQAMEARDADGERGLLETALRNLQLVELQSRRFRDLAVERGVRLQRERVDLARLVCDLGR